MIDTLIYIILSIIYLVVVSTQVYFVKLEGISIRTIAIVFQVIINSVIWTISAFSFYKNNDKTRKIIIKRNFFSILVILIFIGIIGESLILNISKKTLGFDAIALYDARAKFLSYGLKFSQMTQLTIYDNNNSYYYLLYPPFTSIVHYFWNSINLGINVGVLYSINLSFIGIIFLLMALKKIKPWIALICTILVVSDKTLFNLSLVEYTNLPFTLLIFSSIILLSQYLKERRRWQYYLSCILIGGSIWIRAIEPIWLVVILSLLLHNQLDIKRALKNLSKYKLFLLCSLIGFFSWRIFVNLDVLNQSIIKLDIFTIIEPVLGLFSGSLFNVLRVIISSWWKYLLFYLLTILFVQKIKNGDIRFLKLTIVYSLVLYLVIIYFSSFVGDWWVGVAKDSISRSGSYLFPLAIYLLSYGIKFRDNKKNGKKSKNN